MSEQTRRAEELKGAGLAAHEKGDVETARLCYEDALKLTPDDVDLQFYYGTLLSQAGLLEQAVDILTKVLNFSPYHASAMLNLALSYLMLGKATEAYGGLLDMLNAHPFHEAALNQMAFLCQKLSRYVEAAKYFERLIEVQPWREFELTLWLQTNLRAAGRFAEAIEHVDRMKALPGNPEIVQVELATALVVGGIYQPVDDYLGQIALDTTDAHVAMQASFLESAMRRFDKAEAYGRRAIELGISDGYSRLNLSMFLLAQGKLAEGWREYDFRFGKNSALTQLEFEVPEWDGRPLCGGRVLVHSEQGLGDVLQFLRFFPLMEERGAKVIFTSYPDILALLKQQKGAEVRADVDNVDLSYQYHLPMMSLGKIFCDRLESMPQNIPYLAAPEDKVKHWACELKKYTEFKVGLVWSGGLATANDYMRSAMLREYAALSAVPGVQFFSLQKGPLEKEVEWLPDGLPVIDLSSQIRDFGDTAAIIENLDLVLTIDSSVSHLAGALGKQTWLLIASISDWRWLDKGDRSPWYPNVRIFRRQVGEVWADVMPEVADALSMKVRDSAGADTLPLLDLYFAASAGADAFRAHALALLGSEQDCNEVASRILVLNAIRAGNAEWLLEQGARIHPRWVAHLHTAVHGLVAALPAWEGAWHAERSVPVLEGLCRACFAVGNAVAAGKYVEAAGDLPQGHHVMQYLRGQVHRHAGRYGEAEACYRTALQAVPRWPEALTNLAVVCERQDKISEALYWYQYGAARNWKHGPLWTNLGLTLVRLKKFAAAEMVLRHALEISPDAMDIRYWLGAVLFERNQDESARTLFESLQDVYPQRDLLAISLAGVLTSMERFEDALLQYQGILRRNPDDHLARMAMGMLQLRRGDFVAGWANWEARLLIPDADSVKNRVSTDADRWDGTSLNGRRLLVYLEQGLGDAFQSVRFLDLIAGDVLAAVHDVAYSLLREACPHVAFVRRTDVIEGKVEFDCYIEAMSLPAVLQLGERIQAIHRPYLHVPGFDAADFEHYDGVAPGRRIGIVWAGNPNHGMDAQRSCPLTELLPLFEIPGLEWFSLQKDKPSNQVYFLPKHVKLHNAAVQCETLEDTARFIAGLDLFICVDTALAHLAGAMGKDVWLLISRRSDWRWGTRDRRLNWYPTMRVFQQSKLADWSALVTDEVLPALDAWVQEIADRG